MGNLPFWEITAGLPLSAINSKWFWAKEFEQRIFTLSGASYCGSLLRLWGRGRNSTVASELCCVWPILMWRWWERRLWFSIHRPLSGVYNETELLECLDLSTWCAMNFKGKAPNRTDSDYCSRLKWSGLKEKSLSIVDRGNHWSCEQSKFEYLHPI